MNEFTHDIYVNIVVTMLLSVGAFLFRPIQNFFTIRKKGGLVGEWYAVLTPNSPNMKDVVIQKVAIEHKLHILDLFKNSFGLLDIKCIECRLGYAWQGAAHVSNGRFLIGEWWSIKEGAHQRGAFMLTISAQGDVLYGYASGFNDIEQFVMKKWVIGKSKADLKKGLTFLKEHKVIYNFEEHEFFKQ